MIKKPEYLEWVEIAEQDLNSATFLKSMIPMPVGLFVIIVNRVQKNF